jgi:hypothetical protein
VTLKLKVGLNVVKSGLDCQFAPSSGPLNPGSGAPRGPGLKPSTGAENWGVATLLKKLTVAVHRYEA